MADKKISQLDTASSLDDSDLFPVVQGGTTKKVTKSIALNECEKTANKDQPNGYAGLNGDGEIVGPIILQSITNEVLDSGEIGTRNGTVVLGDGVAAGGLFLPYIGSSDACIVVRRGSTDTENAANLRAAYTSAKALTPGGNALSATNRACVIVPPGRYDFGTGDGSNHGLVLDTQYVDLIGLSRDGTILTSQITTSSRGTLEQTANDVRITNLTIELVGVLGDGHAYHPVSNLPLTRCDHVTFKNAGNYSTTDGLNYSGTYTNCISGDYSFVGTASGTFINCACGNYSFGGGWGGAASGTFVNCTAGDSSFGTADGGNGLTGTLRDCDLEVNGIFWVASTGVVINCKFKQTQVNSDCLQVSSGAKIYNSTIIANGTGKSINAYSAASVEISNCYTPQGIGSNVTITNDDAKTCLQLIAVAADANLSTGDGKMYFTIPARLNGLHIRKVRATVITAGTTGTTDIQLANVTDTTDLFSTKLTIDSGETSSDTAATAAVITFANAACTTNEVWRVDIDAVSTTAPKGLILSLEAW